MATGIINEQGFPYENTGAGYTGLNESDQRIVKSSANSSSNPDITPDYSSRKPIVLE